MNRIDAQKIIENESLFFPCNFFQDRADGKGKIIIQSYPDYCVVYQTDSKGNCKAKKVFIFEESALEDFVARLRSAKIKKYLRLLKKVGAKQQSRILVSKTFVSQHEFEAVYHELWKTEDGDHYALTWMDPAPGGYGEEFMYIREVHILHIPQSEICDEAQALCNRILTQGEDLKLKKS